MLTVAHPSKLGAVWRADRLATDQTLGHPTGYSALDAELTDRGWPQAGLVDILGDTTGSEWLLLAPSLASARAPGVLHTRRPILCLAPPHEPYVPALSQPGLAHDQLLRVDTNDLTDAAWAAEQAMQVVAGVVILWWTQGHGQRSVQPPPTCLRRLHLAALEHRATIFAMRSLAAQAVSSPAPLRLCLQGLLGKLAITVVKRRGPPMSKPIIVTAPGLAGLDSRGNNFRKHALTLNSDTTNPKEEGAQHDSTRAPNDGAMTADDALARALPA